MEEDSLVEIQVPDLPPIQLPIIYKENKDGTLNTSALYESMALSTVVEHDGKIFRLRMPNAKSYIDKSIRVTVHDATEESAKTSFHHEKEPILNYRRIQLKRDSGGSVPSDILDPSHDAEAESASSSVYSMLDNEEEGLRNITLDCFSIELGGSAHYLTYIAGQWYISFSNFFKFFSEDYRRKNIDDIAAKVKDISKTFLVKGDRVGDLIAEVYPMWMIYGKRNIINTQFYDVAQIQQVIKDHMNRDDDGNEIDNAYFTPYPSTQWDTKAFKKEKKRIMADMEKMFWKYVSLRPVWDTKERFDSFFQQLGLNPEEYYQNLTENIAIQSIQKDDSDYDSSDDDSADESNPTPVQTKSYNYIDITYADIKEWVGAEKADKYVKSYAKELLERLDIFDTDIQTIVQKFFGDTIDINADLSLERLQEAMQN